VVQLEASKLFSQLPAPDLAALRKIATERQFEPGSEIFKEGDRGDGLYVVKDGLVEISGLLSSQVRHVFSRLGPGEIFGEMAVIDQKPRSACATAAQPTLLYFISCGDMQTLVERSPALAMALLREISHRLREFDRRYIDEILQIERTAVIGRFARSIIHDLKNPLSIISITAELAGLPNATPEMRGQSQTRIRKQVDRISELIAEILDFTAGANKNFVPAAMDYASFAKPLLEELAADADLRNVKLDVQNQPPVVLVPLDPRSPGVARSETVAPGFL